MALQDIDFTYDRLGRIVTTKPLVVGGAISSVTDPTNLQDAATKNYVDTNAAIKTGNNSFTGTNNFVDANFSISDDTTPTKIAKFEVAGLSAGTTTFALPAIGTTIVGRSTTDTLTNKTMGAWSQTDATDITLGTTTGTKIGTATTQKLGFFNATPVVQQANTTDLGSVLGNLGLRAVGANYVISTSGSTTLTGATAFGVSATRTTSSTLTSTTVAWNPCDATAGAFTLTLPAANARNGQFFYFKKIDVSANTITITRGGTDLIDGGTSLTLTAQYSCYWIINDNVSNWYVMGKI